MDPVSKSNFKNLIVLIEHVVLNEFVLVPQANRHATNLGPGRTAAWGTGWLIFLGQKKTKKNEPAMSMLCAQTGWVV